MKRALWFFVALCIACVFTASASAQEDMPPPSLETSLKGQKIIMIVAPKDFKIEEYYVPKELFEGAGAEVMTASLGVDEAVSVDRKRARVNTSLSNVNVDGFDAVVFVGGPGASALFDNADAKRIAVDAVEKDKVLGAICIAPMILANAGVLTAKRATGFSSIAQGLLDKKVLYTGLNVEVDGKIVTARGPENSRQFTQEVANTIVRYRR
jgi:protease I